MPKKGGLPEFDWWTPDFLKEHLKSLPEGQTFNLTRFCKEKAGKQWQQLYVPAKRWRLKDRDLALMMQARMGRKIQTDLGRPSKELSPEGANWRQEFIVELLQTGDRSSAAAITPYSPRQIRNFLNKEHEQYDELFANMLEEAELRIMWEMEGGLVQAFRDADEPRDRAWIAKSFLERRDPTRWGRQVEYIHSGKVAHDHKVEVVTRTREDLLLALFTDQKAFMKREVPQLTAAPIDVEWVEVKEEEKVSVIPSS